MFPDKPGAGSLTSKANPPAGLPFSRTSGREEDGSKALEGQIVVIARRHSPIE